MRRLLAIVLAAASTVASAQTSPDEQWSRPPEGPQRAPPPPPAAVQPQAEPEPKTRETAAPPRNAWPVEPTGPTLFSTKPKVIDAPNRTSMFGANALGQWKRGQSLVLGFPLLSLRVNFGVLDRLDLGVGFDSFYGSMNEPHLHAKLEFARTERWSFAAMVEGSVAFFTVRAAREVRGARWITGHRNYNVTGGFVASYQADKPRSPRVFFSAQYLLAFDTEPFATDPLAGVPAALVLGHNVLTRGGVEMPLSERTSFIFALMFEVHGRADDSRVMPGIALGLVTGL